MALLTKRDRMPRSKRLNVLGQLFSRPKRFANEWSRTQQDLAQTQRELYRKQECLAEADRRINNLIAEKDALVKEGRRLAELGQQTQEEVARSKARFEVSHGYLDAVTISEATGWAVSPSGEAPLLALTIDGDKIMEFRPSLPRSDLEGRFATSFLGFAIPIKIERGAQVAVTDLDGRHLHGSPAKPRVPGREALLSALRKSMRILEVGPGYNPMAPKSEGWNSFSIDHTRREELVKKYEAMSGPTNRIPVNKIEEVDFVWANGPLETAVPREYWGTFDVCIASHLIEHIPNPLGFYSSMEKLIAEDGGLLLVVPDKRFTFDFFKPHSTMSQLVQAHFEKRTRHTRVTAFDRAAISCKKASGPISWGVGTNIQDLILAFENGLSDAMAAYERVSQSEDAAYVDSHGWFYTPSSFALTILEANALGLTQFKMERSYPTEGCEFYVSLARGRVAIENLTSERLRLNKEIIFELAEQAEALRLTSDNVSAERV